MSFSELLTLAKAGDSGVMEKLLELYRPLMLKAAIISGEFDEDLFQELQIVFCVVSKDFGYEGLGCFHTKQPRFLGTIERKASQAKTQHSYTG